MLQELKLREQVLRLNIKYFEKKGEIISSESLAISKAKEFVELIEHEIVPLIKLIEIKQNSEDETIIFDMEIEVSQIRKNDIKNKERIAVSFSKNDNCLPLVEALRFDFPSVPHLNSTQQGFPKSICLFDRLYEEIEFTLNPAKIISQIRYWLEATSRGELHDIEQPLEIIMFNSNHTIFLPKNILRDNQIPLFKIKQFKNKIALLPFEEVDYHSNLNMPLYYYPLLVTAEPQVHGTILKVPCNLEALNSIAQNWHIDLIEKICNSIKNIIELPLTKNKKLLYNANLLVIISIPKKRIDSGITESFECHSFVTEMKIIELAKHFGISDRLGNFNGLIIGKKPEITNLASISILHLNTGFMMSKQNAAMYNNEYFDTNPNISIIGVGALGSKLCMNLARSGFGNFNLLDDDWFLPHNAARHVLTGSSIGQSKAEAMCNVVNSIIYEEKICRSYPYNVLKDKKEIKAILEDSDIIIDMSTSIAVERYLGIDLQSDARKFSVFLNPSGKDLVILAEDIEKKCRIDWLEMQYYRYIINESNLTKHISDFPQDIRYSNSCRDISSCIPNDYIAIHAATASRVIKATYKETSSKILISQLCSDNFNLETKEYKSTNLINLSINDWNICTDEYFMNIIQNKRQEKLPNETGGIILGSFDFKRKIIYMVDIYCPEDNLEYPTAFIRGCKNLQKKLEEISINTANNIEYIGEWHSHPRNCSISMSILDEELLNYLHLKRSPEGYPGVLVIMSDENENMGIYIR